MCQTGKKELRVFFLAAFHLIVIIWACGDGNVAAAEVPLKGAVEHVHLPDKSHKTYLNLFVGKSFTGKLPDDIDSITVTGPDGQRLVDKKGFEYLPQTSVFWAVLPGAPSMGEYTFTLRHGTSLDSTTDIQSVVQTIPVPDMSHFKPALGETCACLTPAFSWPSVNNPGDLYYRLQIRDMHRKVVYNTDYLRDMYSLRMAPGILKPGGIYQWRIIAADGPDWITLNNRSQSRWMNFSIDWTTQPCRYHYATPIKSDEDWDISSLKNEGVDRQKITDLIQSILDGDIQDVHSVLIVKNDKLILEEYFYGYTRDRLHRMNSVSKSITSLLIGIAIDQNKIPDIDHKIYKFFPSYKDMEWDDLKKTIGLKHVLSMTAGLDWNDGEYSDTDPRSTSQAMIKSDDWIKFTLERDMVAPPGQDFTYSNGLTMVLGGIIKNTTGEYADEFAQKHLFGPLGISNYGWEKRSDGAIITAWGLELRPRDMVKIGLMMLKMGKWQDKQIVPSSWVKESTKKQSQGDNLLSSGYGFQWWRGSPFINGENIDLFYAAGKGGQYIFVCPELELVTVFTSKAKDHEMGEIIPQLLMTHYILPAMRPPVPSPQPIKLNPDMLDNYVGDYEYKRLKMPMTIFKKDNSLFFRYDQDTGVLVAETPSRFHGASKDIGAFQADFIQGDTGKIKYFTIPVGFGNWQFDKIK